MKKVIDGKMYNTDSADKLADWSYSDPGDFKYHEKILYRTKKGTLFMYETGGAMSPMAVSLGNNNTGGSSTIYPVSEEEAIQFLETEADDGAEILEKEFADAIEEA